MSPKCGSKEGGWAITGASAVVESPDSTKATQGKAACSGTLQHICVKRHQYEFSVTSNEGFVAATRKVAGGERLFYTIPPPTSNLRFKDEIRRTNQILCLAKNLPLGAALDTQGHNPIRPKPHNTSYCANNGTAPEWIQICFLRGWIAKMKIRVLSFRSMRDWKR